jgi:hypothetical protein
MKISIHVELKTKFVHADELNLRKQGYSEAIDYHKIDIDVNHRESTLVNDLIHELNGTSSRLLIDCMPVALDDAGHDIMLIDIYDTEVRSIEAVKQIFNKYANKLCDDSQLHFESRTETEEFQLLVTQKIN